MALFLAGGEALSGQTAAHVEYRNGRVGVGVAIGNRPVRVSPRSAVARGWVAADWGPVRIRVATRRPSWTGRSLKEKELRYLLGRETVKRIERTTSVLEVTVDRIPVAELYDYRSDGFIDELFLTGPPRFTRAGDWRYRRYGDWDDDRYDWDDDRYRWYPKPK